MQGWLILRHSISMVTGNFAEAIRIALPIIAVLVIALVFIGPNFFFSNQEVFIETWTSHAIVWILQILTGLWTAVAWHRFILIEERPAGLPALHGGPMLQYFLRGLLMFVLIVLAGAIVGAILAGALAFVSPYIAVYGPMVGGFVIGMILFYRLSPMLPAAALGNKLAIKEAWAATKGMTVTILFISVALTGAGFGGNLLIEFIFGGTNILSAGLAALLQLALTIVGLSVLTTIYGVAIEKRDLRP